MRTYMINGVEMYRCHSCAKLFPFDRKTRIAACTSCIDALKPPPEPELTEHEVIVAKFREMNADYIESLRESLRERRSTAMQTRRSREAAVISNFTLEDWRKCKKSFGNQCAYCGEKECSTRS